MVVPCLELISMAWLNSWLKVVIWERLWGPWRFLLSRFGSLLMNCWMLKRIHSFCLFDQIRRYWIGYSSILRSHTSSSSSSSSSIILCYCCKLSSSLFYCYFFYALLLFYFFCYLSFFFVCAHSLYFCWFRLLE